MPARAGLLAVLDEPAPLIAIVARGEAGLPAGVAGLRVGMAEAACDGCDGRESGTMRMADALATGGRGAALPVNVAIVALGALWLALMARRMQQHRTAMGPISGEPQPAAGGR